MLGRIDAEWRGQSSQAAIDVRQATASRKVAPLTEVAVPDRGIRPGECDRAFIGGIVESLGRIHSMSIVESARNGPRVAVELDVAQAAVGVDADLVCDANLRLAFEPDAARHYPRRVPHALASRPDPAVPHDGTQNRQDHEPADNDPPSSHSGQSTTRVAWAIVRCTRRDSGGFRMLR